MPDENSRPVVVIAAIMHESNSFCAGLTRLEDFRFRAAEGDRALEQWSEGNTEMAGFIQEGRRLGFALAPAIYAQATPSGPVASEAFEALAQRLTGCVRGIGSFDAIFLALHGAMYSERYAHADEEIVRRVRAAAPGVPLIVTHDFHANISPATVEFSDVLLTYQQNPHIDTRQRGARAASILSRMLAGQVKPRQAIVKPAVLWNIVFQNTFAEPLRPVTEASIELERQPGILAASVAGGYQYNDVPYVGPSVIVVTDGEADRAASEAQRLSDLMWSRRQDIKLNLPDPAQAVREAQAAEHFPVVLFDVGDNVGGGAPGDETALLRELLDQNATGWLVAFHDPQGVERAKTAGIGGIFDADTGAHSQDAVTKPVRVRGTVRSLHDGRFTEPEVRHGGLRNWDMGHCAVIEEQHSSGEATNLLLLTSKRTSPFSLHQLISCGIYPQRHRIITVKGTVAPRAAYEPIAARIQLVDTPGVTSVNPARFKFTQARPGIVHLNA